MEVGHRMNLNDHLTVEEAAAYCRVHKATVYRWLMERRRKTKRSKYYPPAKKWHGIYLFAKRDLDNYLQVMSTHKGHIRRRYMPGPKTHVTVSLSPAEIDWIDWYRKPYKHRTDVLREALSTLMEAMDVRAKIRERGDEECGED